MTELTKEELTATVETIRQQYGYDFTGYSVASLRRRVQRCMEAGKVKTFFDLKYKLTNSREFFQWFLETLTVNVTEMFRDPSFYAGLRDEVLPKLASYPSIKIWHAGCATGEEVFSMAILLHEAGLLSRTRIYATDLNPANLDNAQKGILPLSQMKEYTQNYQRSGGKKEFSEYYTARYDQAILRKDLRENIVFLHHNLVTDGVFNEFQLICCRNVLIYFNKDLQNKVLRLFYDSLAPLGFLGLGIKESMLFSDLRNKFDTVQPGTKIFRRKS